MKAADHPDPGGVRRAPLENAPLVAELPKNYGSIHTYYNLIVRTAAKFTGSTQTLNRSESMVSLCYRSLTTFVLDDNLQGLQAFLENRQVQVDDRDENGSTALMVAAGKGRIGFVRELLQHGADVNSEDADNWTALLCASKEGHGDVVRLLLDNGADVEHRDMGGWTALMWAAYKGHTDVAILLLEKNADPNAHGNFHISSLLWAAGRGHSRIVYELLRRGAKANVGDKYGTTALVWACRKGYSDIVEALLKANANADTAGMYSWTPLLVAAQGNHVDVVRQLLEHRPNVNALDKDGCTALMIACKEGFHEIATELMNAGAYINVQDRPGDTNLIHAVKGGHRTIAEALLKKYADVDVYGKDRKTAIYTAVEKSNGTMVRLLLTANPDLELATKDGDTPLLRAVRSRQADIVQLLLDRRAKVTAADKRGDTALHIAMRARSKAIVEILLRDPKNSQLLYRANKQGETPYNMDLTHEKRILGQVFGARRLNTNEDNENMLGYDLYSSALADMLSEPSLSVPITVGLYARWGSGKSFLLEKLRKEMENFARQWTDPASPVLTSPLLLLLVAHVAAVSGVAAGLAAHNWIVGAVIAAAVVALAYGFAGLSCYLDRAGHWRRARTIIVAISRRLDALGLLLQVAFCHPPTDEGSSGSSAARPVSFRFADRTRVTSSGVGGGEAAVLQMVGSLFDAVEDGYGAATTRLYRALRPRPAAHRLRRTCCVPHVLLLELCALCALGGAAALALRARGADEGATLAVAGTCGAVLAVALTAHAYTLARIAATLAVPHRRRLAKATGGADYQRALAREVALLRDMVACLDRLSGKQTRLVVVVDGLDSCEQDRVLAVLDAVHVLFSEPNGPFVVVLAIDPHVISKVVETGSRRLFVDASVGIAGHDYLRNLVHLPFYLQNSGLRRVRAAQAAALPRSLSTRRLSLAATETGRKGRTATESLAGSMGSQLNVAGAHDLSRMLLTDDYFSDVNPRSMRRLMNVLYVTGRLLKAFQIDFSWYHLANWVNITEQWPYRTSWLALYCESHEDQLEDCTPLKTLYDRVRPEIPSLREREPLLDLDRDERKFDVFLAYHRSSLQVGDLKVFLPFAINLDPYVRKVIKEACAPSKSKLKQTIVRPRGLSAVTHLPPAATEMKLSTLDVAGVCRLLDHIDELPSESITRYSQTVKQNNINGRVLLHCDLSELKRVLKMTFGDWEMFRVLLVSMREHELTSVVNRDERSVRFFYSSNGSSEGTNAAGTEAPQKKKHAAVEKQITLEDQMICGALQTLNEEACEDVLEETIVPQTALIPPSPPDVTGGGCRSRTGSVGTTAETDFVILQANPFNRLRWQPVSVSSSRTDGSHSENSSACSSPQAQRRGDIIEMKPTGRAGRDDVQSSNYGRNSKHEKKRRPDRPSSQDDENTPLVSDVSVTSVCNVCFDGRCSTVHTALSDDSLSNYLEPVSKSDSLASVRSLSEDGSKRSLSRQNALGH